MARNMRNIVLAIALMLCVVVMKTTDGHGMMLDPPSRSVMWKYGFKVPENYDANGLNCGGYSVRIKWDLKCNVKNINQTRDSIVFKLIFIIIG